MILEFPYDVQVKNNDVRTRKAVKWVFTLNNYTECEYTEVLGTLKKAAKNFIVGKEVGAEGTPHLQGAFVSNGRKKLAQLKQWPGFERAHFETMRGSTRQAFDYCLKEDKDAVYHFPEYDERRRLASSLIDVHTLKDATPDGKVWMRLVWERIEFQRQISAGARTITVVVDRAGNSGKSWFTKSVLFHDPQALAGSGKVADVTMLIGRRLASGQPVSLVIWDLPRCLDEKFVSYGAIEQVKNGCITHTKGCGSECGQYLFSNPAVVIFCNNHLDYSKLSTDRWDVYELKQDGSAQKYHIP